MKQALRAALGGAVELRSHRRSTGAALALRGVRGRGVSVLEVHEVLLNQLDAELIAALEAWSQRPRDPEVGRALDAALAPHQEALTRFRGSRRQARAARAVPRGETWDLKALWAQLVLPAQGSELQPSLGWARFRRRRRPPRSLRLGSCQAEVGLIRVHPVLDSPVVPEAVLRSVLFHEACHLLAPPRAGQHHHAEFRLLNRADPDHPVAERWLAENLGALCRAAGRARRFG